MEETKQPLVLRLGRGFNGFFCPETRFHLIGVMKPQAVYTAAFLSEDVKRGLRGRTLIDVNGILSEDEIKPGKGYVHNVNASDRKKQILIQADEQAKEKQEADAEKGIEKDDYLTPDADAHGELISEPDILSGTKKELLAFIEKTEGLELEALDLNSRSGAEEVKTALLKHFGYSDKPVDLDAEAEAAKRDEE